MMKKLILAVMIIMIAFGTTVLAAEFEVKTTYGEHILSIHTGVRPFENQHISAGLAITMISEDATKIKQFSVDNWFVGIYGEMEVFDLATLIPGFELPSVGHVGVEVQYLNDDVNGTNRDVYVTPYTGICIETPIKNVSFVVDYRYMRQQASDDLNEEHLVTFGPLILFK